LFHTYDEIRSKVEGRFVPGSAEAGDRRLTGPGQARMVFDFVKQTSNDAWICEIGTLYGFITAVMGLACLGSNRRVVTIDHMIGLHCMDMITRPKCIYTEFVDNMIYLGVWNKIIPLPMKSFGDIDIEDLKEELLPLEMLRSSYLQAFEMLVTMGIKFEYIYIDGNHNTENVLGELERYTTILKKGGIITGDDCEVYGKNFKETFEKRTAPSTINQVAKAVFEFFPGKEDQFEPVEVSGNQFGFKKL
jgi:hypothetical protein